MLCEIMCSPEVATPLLYVIAFSTIKVLQQDNYQNDLGNCKDNKSNRSKGYYLCPPAKCFRVLNEVFGELNQV